MMPTLKWREHVHIWCSRDHLKLQAKDCDMCQRFHEKYPMEGFNNDVEMAAKYFPRAIPRT